MRSYRVYGWLVARGILLLGDKAIGVTVRLWRCLLYGHSIWRRVCSGIKGRYLVMTSRRRRSWGRSRLYTVERLHGALRQMRTVDRRLGTFLRECRWRGVRMGNGMLHYGRCHGSRRRGIGIGERKAAQLRDGKVASVR